jgi:hypothetical protein
MNNYDRTQLNFIMNLSDEDFEAWADQVDADDIQYAMELIQQARLEMALQEQELMEADLEDSDFAEARAVLKQFTLG